LLKLTVLNRLNISHNISALAAFPKRTFFETRTSVWKYRSPRPASKATPAGRSLLSPSRFKSVPVMML